MTAVAPEFRRARPARPPRTGRISWLSGRSLLLHLTLVVVAPVCLVAGWWQLDRALSGNTLSFVYVFEWPAFAGVAVWSWWALLTAPTRSVDPVFPARPAPVEQPGTVSSGARRPGAGTARTGAELLAARRSPLRWGPGEESGRLRAYNSYLAELGARPGRRGRLPRRPPGGRRA